MPDPRTEVDAVLDVLAPWKDTGITGIPPVRVPLIGLLYDGMYLSPTDDQLTAVAQQIVTAIRTASASAATGKRQP